MLTTDSKITKYEKAIAMIHRGSYMSAANVLLNLLNEWGKR